MAAPGFAGSRRNHLCRLWADVVAQPVLPQLDRWLADNFRKNARYGSRDRRWYSEMLFAAVRHGYLALFCDFCVRNRAPFLGKNENRNAQYSLEQLFEAFLKLYPNVDSITQAWRTLHPDVFFADVWNIYSRTSSTVEERPSSEDSLAVSQTMQVLKALELSSSLRARMLLSSVPLWLFEQLNARASQSAWKDSLLSSFLANQNTRPPLWLRVNHSERLTDIVSILRSEGYLVEQFDQALCVRGERGIFLSEVYKSGSVEIQDFASQKAGASVEAKPGDVVWDACAGGGGKTLQIASRLKNRGAIYASDVREFKLEEVKKRARRAGFFNVRCQAWNGVALPEFPREIQKREGFDWVLVDAPCSSSGTWRRNPDAKYRLDACSVAEVTALQKSILETASCAVGKRGRLVYSTCSWLVEENEGIISNFLENHPNFELVKMKLWGTPEADADTLFSAVLAKRIKE